VATPIKPAPTNRMTCRADRQVQSILTAGHMPVVTDELRHLAETVAQWADKTPGLRVVHLFGSRVRGDHRPDSDVDLCIFPTELADDNGTASWWTRHTAGGPRSNTMFGKRARQVIPSLHSWAAQPCGSAQASMVR
jgi:Polymerase beta, Nucleotidyltransferase